MTFLKLGGALILSGIALAGGTKYYHYRQDINALNARALVQIADACGKVYKDAENISYLATNWNPDDYHRGPSESPITIRCWNRKYFDKAKTVYKYDYLGEVTIEIP